MRKIVLRTLLGLLVLVLLAVAGMAWFLRGKQAQRTGKVSLTGLAATVSVRFDERGVPYIEATNEPDLYRTLVQPGPDRPGQWRPARRHGDTAVRRQQCLGDCRQQSCICVPPSARTWCSGPGAARIP